MAMNPSPASEKKMLRDFGLVMATAVAIVFGLAVPWFTDAALPVWPWLVAAMLAGVALTSPRGLKQLYAAWMRVGQVLNWLVSRLALALVYYAVVVPMGAVMRLVKHDPLRRRLEREAESYRVRSSPPDRKHLERPF